MSEEVEKGEMGKFAAYGALGLTAVGGLFLLAKVGLVGSVVLGGLATGGVAVHAAVKGENPLTAVTGLFKKIGGFYKRAIASAKKGYSAASEWAHAQQLSAPDNADGPGIGGISSAPDFEKAANANAPAAKVSTPESRATLKM